MSTWPGCPPLCTPHLKKCVPICAAELEERVQWDADDGRQGHEETNGHSPARVLVVVVGDWPVLDHREDKNELQGGEVGTEWGWCEAGQSSSQQ